MAFIDYLENKHRVIHMCLCACIRACPCVCVPVCARTCDWIRVWETDLCV